MDLIQQKSYGPVASLKTALGRQFIFIPFVYAILVIQVILKPALRTDPFFGLFLGIAVLMSVFFALAYFILDNMSKSDATVADQLKRQLRSLQRMLLCYRIVTAAGVVIMVVFLETFKNIGTAQLIQEWYEVDMWLRIAAYAGLLVLSFSASKARFQQEYGKHLDELKKRLADIEQPANF